MSLKETQGNIHFFVYEHNQQYQQVQFTFYDAVESLNPQNIMVNCDKLLFICKKILFTLFFKTCNKLISWINKFVRKAMISEKVVKNNVWSNIYIYLSINPILSKQFPNKINPLYNLSRFIFWSPAPCILH